MTHIYVEHDGVKLAFMPEDEAKARGYETENNYMGIDEPWADLNVYDIVTGTNWVLVAGRFSKGELLTFAMGSDYALRVDMAVPSGRENDAIFAWDYNTGGTFGKALQAVTVITAYRRRVRQQLNKS